MNEMLGRLEDASNRQREFVGNASHELQSPLASFRTQLEVAAAHPEGADWPSLARNLLADGNRMESMVQDLLFLAREDAEATRPTRPVDLDDVVLEEVTRMRSTCTADVHADGVSGAPLPGHREDLARLVRNLLDNACAYASSRVDVTLETTDGRVELIVSDDGPGVAPEDKPRIFDRFYRADPVRNPQSSGTGLGLAIAAAVAEAHGGTITVTDGDPGARFVVSLPPWRRHTYALYVSVAAMTRPPALGTPRDVTLSHATVRIFEQRPERRTAGRVRPWSARQRRPLAARGAPAGRGRVALHRRRLAARLARSAGPGRRPHTTGCGRPGRRAPGGTRPATTSPSSATTAAAPSPRSS